MGLFSHRIAPDRFLRIAAVATLAVLVAVCLLPQDRALRFDSLTDGAVVKAGWIYHRIHDNPAPIDVVFIGSSHTVFGIDATRAADAFAAAGGGRQQWVNFGLQHLGRNVPWLFAREVLRARKVKLLVVEVQEDESRSLHPAFGALADAWDIVDAPWIINTDYLADLSGLPLRQARLFARSLAGAAPPSDTMDDWNDTVIEAHAPGAMPRKAVHSVAELEAERAHFARTIAVKDSLPWPLARLENRANLIYLQRIIQLAAENHVPVRFLYMPNWKTAALPRYIGVYGSVLFPREVYAHREYWQDIAHMNAAGADALSDWVGRNLEVPRR
jgi:hypothetical protein